MKLKTILREIEVSQYQIYCDLDGVLTDFNERYQHFTGEIPTDMDKKLRIQYGDKKGKEEFWNKVNSIGTDFWKQMLWMKDGKQLWNFIKQYKPILLSSPSLSQTSVKGKKEWVNKNLPGIKLELRQAKDKQEFSGPNNILIDDREDTCAQWKAKGGISIVHTSAANTIKELEKLGFGSLNEIKIRGFKKLKADRFGSDIKVNWSDDPLDNEFGWFSPIYGDSIVFSYNGININKFTEEGIPFKTKFEEHGKYILIDPKYFTITNHTNFKLDEIKIRNKSDVKAYWQGANITLDFGDDKIYGGWMNGEPKKITFELENSYDFSVEDLINKIKKHGVPYEITENHGIKYLKIDPKYVTLISNHNLDEIKIRNNLGLNFKNPRIVSVFPKGEDEDNSKIVFDLGKYYTQYYGNFDKDIKILVLYPKEYFGEKAGREFNLNNIDSTKLKYWEDLYNQGKYKIFKKD